MISKTTTATALALLAALSLSACGDGGGGGVSSTPAPNPTSTAAANDDLLAPLVSGSFDSDAVRGTGTFNTSGTGSSSSAKSSLAISFDSTTGAYTVSSVGGRQSFGPANRDSSLSSAQADVFVRTSGNTSESLTLTTNSSGKGTPSNPGLAYVGGGVWQKTILSSTSASGTADAFAYGISTPAANLPKTGAADYSVILRGIAAFPDTALPVRGAGKVKIDFGSGALTGTGQLSAFISAAGPTYDSTWAMNATLASSQNSFDGTMSLTSTGLPTGGSGGISGRLYGPAAQELGAAWFSNPTGGGQSYVGFMLGKDSSKLLTNTGLDALAVNETFSAKSFFQWYDFDRIAKLNMQFSTSFVPSSSTSVSYDEVQGALVIDNAGILTPFALTPSARDASLSTSEYQAFHASRDRIINGKSLSDDIRVWLFRPGSANATLPLTYTDFGYWKVAQPTDPDRYTRIEEGVFAFGRVTPVSQMPTTGSATYSAVIRGQSLYPQGTTNQTPYAITGTASLNFDFASSTFTGSMNPVATDNASSISYNIAPVTFASDPNYVTLGAPTFVGRFSNSFTNLANSLVGQFTGPSAQEFYAEWQHAMVDPVNGGNLAIAGVMVGKK